MLRQAALAKPVLVLKAGRTASGQAATASHTGALAGAHAAFRAACRQTGAIECETVQALMNGALALAYQPLPAGNRVAIVTNAGGPAALAADALEGAGLCLAPTSPATQAVLRSFMLPDAQVAGPVDLLGGAVEGDYQQALAAVLADPANDGVLAVLVPQVLVNSAGVVKAWSAAMRKSVTGKPVLACLMGAASLDEALAAAHAAQHPGLYLSRRGRGGLRRPGPACPVAGRGTPRAGAPVGVDPERAGACLAATRLAGRVALDAAEGREVLSAYGIPTPADLLATTPDEAAAYAAQIGFPVVLKLASPDILHKTDVGGVVVGVQSEAQARDSFAAILQRARTAHPGARIRGVQVQKMIEGGQEVIIGVKRDPTFGPLVMFGLGGVYVEALADVSFRPAPLTPGEVQEMIGEVRSARLLSGLRGAAAADRAARGRDPAHRPTRLRPPGDRRIGRQSVAGAAG